MTKRATVEKRGIDGVAAVTKALFCGCRVSLFDVLLNGHDFLYFSFVQLKTSYSLKFKSFALKRFTYFRICECNSRNMKNKVL